MGIVLSRVFQALFGSKEVRILILGLDNAGKTTILYRLQNEADDNIQTIPTIGFNVETLQYRNIKFQVSHFSWCSNRVLLSIASKLEGDVVKTSSCNNSRARPGSFAVGNGGAG